MEGRFPFLYVLGLIDVHVVQVSYNNTILCTSHHRKDLEFYWKQLCTREQAAFFEFFEL